MNRRDLEALTPSHRSLYNAEFLSNGCVDISDVIFDETDQIDNLPWTFATNYAITFVTWIFVLLIQCGFRRPRDDQEHSPPFSFRDVDANQNTTPRTGRDSQQILMQLFFVLNGLGYGIAGIDHQITDNTNDRSTLHSIITTTGHFAAGVAGMLLNGVAFEVLDTTSRHLWHRVLWVVLNLTFGIVALVLQSFFLLGLWIVVSYSIYLLSLVISVCRCLRQRAKDKSSFSSQQGGTGRDLLLKIIATLFAVIGLGLQPILGPVCGDQGYEVCFEDCPLPSPTVFNHNALFHVFMIVSFVLLAVSEWNHPTRITTEAVSLDDEQIDSRA